MNQLARHLWWQQVGTAVPPRWNSNSSAEVSTYVPWSIVAELCLKANCCGSSGGDGDDGGDGVGGSGWLVLTCMYVLSFSIK